MPPPPCEVPRFAPLRVRGGRYRVPGAVRRSRRATAAGLAMGAVALAMTGLRGIGPAGAQEPGPPGAPERERHDVDLVSAPVRIADAETVRLLRPGDQVDVIAAPSGGGTASRVVAGARVTELPAAGAEDGFGGDRGALVVLSVPRAEAARLAGAGVRAELAVVVC